METGISLESTALRRLAGVATAAGTGLQTVTRLGAPALAGLSTPLVPGAINASDDSIYYSTRTSLYQ